MSELFEIRDGTLIRYNGPAKGDVTIPEGVTAIGDFSDVGPFSGCLLGRVTVPRSVKKLVGKAFRACDVASIALEGLESTASEDFAMGHYGEIVFPGTLKKLGGYTFATARVEELRFTAPVVGDLELGDYVFASAEIGTVWVPQGADKLAEALKQAGCPGEIRFYTPEVPSSPAPAAAAPADENAAIAAICKYKELLDAGILTQEEFTAKKRQLLGI